MDVVIIGAGGHGKVVLDILLAENKHRIIGFLDADTSLTGTTIAGVPVIGPINQLLKLKSQKVKGALIAIGDNRIRAQYAKEAQDAGLELINAIHPRASIAKSATLGKNVIVAMNASICTEAMIGDHTIVNTAAIVDHECVIGNAVHICPGAALAGRVRVEDYAFIGMGSRIIQCLTIGAGSIVGAGAIVRADLPADVTAVGVPARIIKTHD